MVEMARQPYDYPGEPDRPMGAIEPTLFPDMHPAATLGYDGVSELDSVVVVDTGLSPEAQERRDRMRDMRRHLERLQEARDAGQGELFTLVRIGSGTGLAPNPDIHLDSHS